MNLILSTTLLLLKDAGVTSGASIRGGMMKQNIGQNDENTVQGKVISVTDQPETENDIQQNYLTPKIDKVGSEEQRRLKPKYGHGYYSNHNGFGYHPYGYGHYHGHGYYHNPHWYGHHGYGYGGAVARYEADLGDHGIFRMSIDDYDGTVSYDVDLVNLDWVTVDELSWHLHSGRVGPGARDASDGPAVACGPDYTAGHYDPMLKCGPASTAQECGETEGISLPCCPVKPAVDYCTIDNIGACEVGDLSGLYGAVPIIDSKGKKTAEAEGFCPDCLAHYDPHASAAEGTAAYNTWNSIVFHGTEDSPGTRVLCANIVQVSGLFY